MERIAVIGDSNSTPYFENDNSLTPMNNLFPYLLAEDNFEVIPMSFVSNTTEKIIKRSDFFIKNAKAKYFIIQIGWIDSSSKQFPKWLETLINLKLKGSKKILQKLVSHYENYYKKNYHPLISQDKFQSNLIEIIQIIKKDNPEPKIIFLTIPYSPDKLINKYRIKYNQIIKDISNEYDFPIIDTYELTKNNNMLNNSGHFDKEAHKKIALLIKQSINKISQ